MNALFTHFHYLPTIAFTYMLLDNTFIQSDTPSKHTVYSLYVLKADKQINKQISYRYERYEIDMKFHLKKYT